MTLLYVVCCVISRLTHVVHLHLHIDVHVHVGVTLFVHFMKKNAV